MVASDRDSSASVGFMAVVHSSLPDYAARSDQRLKTIGLVRVHSFIDALRPSLSGGRGWSGGAIHFLTGRIAPPLVLEIGSE
jgi:hypothetical protein